MKKENRLTATYEFPLEIIEQNSEQARILSLPHWHELVEIIYNQEGELHIQLGEANLLLYPGDICLINQYGIHSTRSEGRIRGAVFFFDPSLVLGNIPGRGEDRDLQEIITGNKSIIIPADNTEYFKETVSALLEAKRFFFTEKKGHLIFSKASLLRFFGCLIAYPLLVREVPNPNHRTERDRLDKIMTIINLQGTGDISLTEIAGKLNLSTYRFCHVFRELTGYTFSQYLLRFRLIKAQELLIGNDSPITEVALACGFNNVNYFNRAFKKLTGYTPRSYRTKFRTKSVEKNSAHHSNLV